MSGLAGQAISLYTETDRDKYLGTLFRLQMTAGRHADADATLASLRELRLVANPQAVDRLLPFAIYAKAKTIQNARRISFVSAVSSVILALSAWCSSRSLRTIAFTNSGSAESGAC